MSEISISKKLGSLFAILGVHHTARLFVRLWFDRRMPWFLKLSAVSGLIYIFSPLDVIPDISGIGLLDDFIVALLIMQAFLECAPEYLLRLHCDRLGIEPEQALIDVPRTIRDALALYDWAVSRSWGMPPPPEGAEAQAQADEQAGPPPFVRYSAFQGEKEQA